MSSWLNMKNVNINFETDIEKSSMDIDEIKSLLKNIYKQENIDQKCELNIIFVDNQYIHRLNKRYRNIDSATDVLSFPVDTVFLPDGVCILGDIFISIERAKEQAKMYNVSLLEEVKHLVIHGILHLLGYHHNTEEQRIKMQDLERKYLTLGCDGVHTKDESIKKC